MYEDSAGSACFEQLAQAMYAHHPLRVPIAGTVESIKPSHRSCSPLPRVVLRPGQPDALRRGRCLTPAQSATFAAALMPQHTRPVPRRTTARPKR